jgi:Neurotransmitter-gated ion-channel ligand binding domain/Neurotransmitter-gated ion-channel transmembrane region
MDKGGLVLPRDEGFNRSTRATDPKEPERMRLATPIVILFLALLVFTQTTLARETEVSVGIYIVDILRIDDANQTMTVDFNIRASWIDENMIGAHNTDQKLELHEVWSPELQLVNEVNLRRRRTELITVTPEGRVIQKQRFVGEISCFMDFKRFPWDEQTFSIDLAALSSDSIKFVSDSTRNGLGQPLSIANWAISQGQFVQRTHHVVTDKIDGCAYEFRAKRLVGYYIWKVFLPLAMIVFMSWAVFWIDPRHIEPQLAVAATSMLTMIAYQFSLSYLVPKLPYLTHMDEFIVGSNILVFLALAESVLTSNMVAKEHADGARRIDRAARWIFPIIYGLIIIKMRLF